MSVLVSRAPDSLSATVYVGTTDNNIRYELAPGIVDFYGDTVLIWRLRYDSAGCTPESNGIWTTFGFRQETISGASTTDPVEVADWTTGNETLYVNVNDVRRMKIDVANTLIHTSALRVTETGSVAGTYSSAPIVDSTWFTGFNVYDPNVEDFRTAMSLDTSGILYTENTFTWHQAETTGGFL
jgi:hypothetical protein